MGGHTFRAGPISPTRKAPATMHPHTSPTRRTHDTGGLPDAGRDDGGFSFVQLMVAMVISGILLTAVGVTVFNQIGRARQSVLATNIVTAAEAVRNTIALNPTLSTPVSGKETEGEVQQQLLDALGEDAPFEWTTTWAFGRQNTPALASGAPSPTSAESAAAPTATSSPANAPTVRWLVRSGDAMRLQVRNEDGSWACALVVMRPEWDAQRAGGALATTGADLRSQTKARLRGIWYDTGSEITNGGLHHCDPVGSVDMGSDPGYGNKGAGGAGDQAATTANDSLPLAGGVWNIPGRGDLSRSAPRF